MSHDLMHDPFVLFALGCAALAALIIIWYLARRPSLTRSTKIILLFGIGLLPIAAAGSGNIHGYYAMKTRVFCGSCHVMTPYAQDSESFTSNGLAARHARNAEFGPDNCYMCHADYGMFGTITTKIGGMRHMYEYMFHFRNLSLEEAIPRIHIRNPFPNETCIRCHSTENPLWNKIGDHTSTLDRIRAGTLSCASEGCHGYAHPFSKEIQKRAEAATEAEKEHP